MFGEILTDILTNLNRRLITSNRNILLLMDNAGCHSQELVSKFSNIKIIFFPPNTTSCLQPLDLGIIQTFKAYYRKHFLTFVLSKIDSCDRATDVIKSVNVLVALRWVALAWQEVSPETISKCFKKAGVLNYELDVVTLGATDGSVDPFSDIDELQCLIEQTGSESCTAREFITGDDNLPICADMDNENWEETFLKELTENEVESAMKVDDEEDECDETAIVVPKLKTYKEIINVLEDVSQFLEFKGHAGEALSVSSFIDRIAVIAYSTAKQTTLDQYFHKNIV